MNDLNIPYFMKESSHSLSPKKSIKINSPKNSSFVTKTTNENIRKNQSIENFKIFIKVKENIKKPCKLSLDYQRRAFQKLETIISKNKYDKSQKEIPIEISAETSQLNCPKICDKGLLTYFQANLLSKSDSKIPSINNLNSIEIIYLLLKFLQKAINYQK